MGVLQYLTIEFLKISFIIFLGFQVLQLFFYYSIMFSFSVQVLSHCLFLLNPVSKDDTHTHAVFLPFYKHNTPIMSKNLYNTLNKTL